jgi:hypothetical protein
MTLRSWQYVLRFGVDLSRAIEIVKKPLRVLGVSTPELADDVNNIRGADGVQVLEAPVLNGERHLRAKDVLAKLAIATRPKHSADLLEVHTHWGLLRYLGFFDESLDGQLHMTLSDAGRGIKGNQRRVTSEEIGVGFASLLAESWIDATPGRRGVMRMVDVDVALDEGVILAGGKTKKVKQITRRRPDYILISESTRQSNSFNIALLECKGTKSPSYVVGQLARASSQLGGLLVGGRRPRGLVVSTLAGDNSVGFFALQAARGETRRAPDPDKDMLSMLGGDSSLSPDLNPEIEVEVVVDTDDLNQGEGEIELFDAEDMAAKSAVIAGIRASWATAADFAGNDEAFQRWAPPPMLRKLPRGHSHRTRNEISLANGLSLRGTSSTIALPGGVLRVVLGLESSVDEALTNGNSERILDAQRRIEGDLANLNSADLPFEQVLAVNSDGTALALFPE